MGRKEKREAAELKRLVYRRYFEVNMDTAFQEMRGSGSINIGALWTNFFRRLDQQTIANDQMAIQELSMYKLEFEARVKKAIAEKK